LALIFLAAGLVYTLYSPWIQEQARQAIVDHYRDANPSINIDHFLMRYPLNLELAGVTMVQDGDTIANVGYLNADLSLWDLLHKQVVLNDAVLTAGDYKLGGIDSAMYMVMHADSLHINPATVNLETMDIDLVNGLISRADVAMYLKTDTTATDTVKEPTKMRINIHDLDIDRLRYKMVMLPTIDSLGAEIGTAHLHDGVIDLEKQTIKLKSLIGSELNAAYIAPDSATVAATTVQETTTESQSEPWTIGIDCISFTKSKGLYTTRGVTPMPGLDFGYISVDSLDMTITDFYNCADVVRVPMSLSGRERCGVKLAANGTIDINSERIAFDSINVNTATTALKASGLMGMGDMMTDNNVAIQLKADGGVGVEDLRLMFPEFLPYLATLPAKDQIKLSTDIDGTIGDILVNNFDLGINNCVKLKAKGNIQNVMNPTNLSGYITMDGSIHNGNQFKPLFLDKATAKEINIPDLALTGDVKMKRGVIDGTMNAVTGSGEIALDGHWNSHSEDYIAYVDCTDFPVNAFMPLLGVGNVTALLDVNGHGYNPFATSTELDAHLDVENAVYNKYAYGLISGDVSLHDGEATVNLDCTNPDAEFTLDAIGNLSGDSYEWVAQFDGKHIDLQALRFSEEEAVVTLDMKATAALTPKTNDLNGQIAIGNFTYERPVGTITVSDLDAQIAANDSTTNVTVLSHDLFADFNAECGLDTLMARFTRAMNIAEGQYKDKRINVDSLQRTLPQFTLNMRAGNDNVINDFLSSSKMSFNQLRLQASNDSVMAFNSRILAFQTGDTRLDTITFDINQHDEHLHYVGKVDNRPGTFDDWAHVKLDGYLAYNQLGAHVTQHNIKDEKGFDLGFKAALVDSLITANVTPYDPIIGYKQWTVNDDNYISYNLNDDHIDANLYMSGDDSSLSIYTDHNDENAGQEDLVIKVANIHLADWIAINPFAPPITGDLGADVRLNHNGKDINGSGKISLEDFTYGKEKVASLVADFDLTTDLGGALRATADLYVDNVKTITVSGNLNESTLDSPLLLDFSMIKFPLATVNPFLPSGTAKLSGVLNGSLAISGTSDNPKFNGWLNFDDASALLALTGTDYTFSDTRVAVNNSVAQFEDFQIKGVNDNPLKINGTVDLSSMTSPRFDLTMKANNMQLVNTSRSRKGADVYGKAFISLDSHVKGNMSFMQVDATLDVLPQTNVTYMMTDATSVITSQSSSDMVKFVNFADTTGVYVADSLAQSSMAMMLNATLNLKSGSIINVDMSSDGKMQLLGSGSLNYTMSPMNTDGRLIGRLNIDGGYVKYSPPVISEKLFTFQPDSYIAFTGDMMNPTLNIKAIDEVKSNVSVSGQGTRSVNFDVELDVTGSLNTMNVVFDLSTDDDITIANELASMSAEQRANQAMNLLLYNMYTGSDTKSDASLTGNLFSFLESQINSWASSAIKGVDLSFGIDQYKNTLDGQTSSSMSYSYQVSKSLFNDRFKIVVGGNYSTDANADENFSQNLINDISFEYYLNSGRTMYVKLFRHTGYESILEGEITETGVGFVYKRKLRRLGDMFRFVTRMRNRYLQSKTKTDIEEAVPTDTIPESE
jgi:hypothetical protein